MYRLFKSFYNAFAGLKQLVITQVNARIHFGITVMVFGLAIFYPIASWEWMFILLAMGLVWMAEAMNTAIEWIVDDVHPGYHQKVGRIKDVAAAGVLLASIFAAIIGLIIFVPRIIY